MSVSEQSAAAKQNAIGSEPPRPALALNVTMLLCGSLAAAGSIALLVLAILRTLAAANTVSVHWADRNGETPRSTSAGALAAGAS